MRLFLILVFLFIPSLEGSDENTVIIQGKRRNKKPRRTATIAPHEETQLDTTTQLNKETSILLPQTGRVTSFIIPRIRGQDASLTEVYFEDDLLQDPYSGLPFLQDVDLRAFGILETSQGLTSYDLARVNPIGALRFLFQPIKATQWRLGTKYGDLHGSSAWGLAQANVSEKLQTQLYARCHRTSGRYSYYSDEGTPYNVEDDRIRVRENNDKISTQLTPFLNSSLGPYKIQAYGILLQSSQGVPSPSPIFKSHARLKDQTRAVSTRVLRDFEFATLNHQLQSALFLQTYNRQTRDPDALFFSRKSSFDSGTFKKQLKYKVELSENLEIQTHIESTRIQLLLKRDLELRSLSRDGMDETISSHYQATKNLELEAKFSSKFHTDKLTSENVAFTNDNGLKSEAKNAQAKSLIVGYGTYAWKTYVQFSESKRLPNLLEQFGNGSSIVSHLTLKPETTAHKECGGTVWFSKLQLDLTLFQDDTTEKIMLTPASLGTFKAKNVQRTSMMGTELKTSYENTFFDVGKSNFETSLTHLLAHDLESHKQLPSIPVLNFFSQFSQTIFNTTTRLASRYRSVIFLDLAHTVEKPGEWVHDLSVDFFVSSPWKIRAGLTVQNILNTLSSPLNTDSHNRGRTALSDYEGAPLPGRSMGISASALL